MIFRYVDEILGLCELTDVYYRLKRATKHDLDHLDSFIVREQSNQVKLKNSISKRRDKVNELSKTDEQSLIETSKASLSSHLKNQLNLLNVAKDEEEKARKVIIFYSLFAYFAPCNDHYHRYMKQQFLKEKKYRIISM